MIDDERRLELLAAEAFPCASCGRTHPLREHGICRGRTATAVAVRLILAAVAFAVIVAWIAWLALHNAVTATP